MITLPRVVYLFCVLMKSNQSPVAIKSDILQPQITHLIESVDINTTTAATRRCDENGNVEVR